MKCKRRDCSNEVVKNKSTQVYCCKQCAPYSHLVNERTSLRDQKQSDKVGIYERWQIPTVQLEPVTEADSDRTLKLRKKKWFNQWPVKKSPD